MKKISLALMAAALLISGLPPAQAQEYGKVRALQERAAYVIRQKNDFVVRVLRSYKIPHEVNDQGVVVRINMNDRWMDVTAIEIVPMLREAEDRSRQVAAHELFFFTADGILDVVSALTIR
ncbi:MAG: hypothetical protein PHW80_06870 [Smithellaceae bacterium]|jgi:hypothetical protein|nr:hypothetical protein [Smithellaceae bacterium]MDD3258883.1 hypothetical protein [Smithellaceae bacterium]MDD3849005.1 hypothetical protein [Smithellaceae bacterium]HOG12118.1 hypothetical protein [Smithellaceae bacterium]HOQ71292.1 hypothetical protein [Smithellaceae bacterium]